MLLKQHWLGYAGHAGYLIGDPEARKAAIIDPRPDLTRYLDDARGHHLEVSDVILTEWQPDTAAVARELGRRCGARISIGAGTPVGYPFMPVRDGDTIMVGALRLAIIETPGHTPAAISILLFDPRYSDRAPYAALTGSTLMIGDVGRPDRVAWGDIGAAEAAGALYESLHRTLLTLPDETLVYPSHGSGTICGCTLSTTPVSTIGAQRRHNYALQPMARTEFVSVIAADRPRVAPRLADQPQCAPAATSPAVWSLAELLAARDEETQIVDVREPVDFAAAHLAGSLNVATDRIGTGVEAVLSRQRPVALIAAPGRERAAARDLTDAGFDVTAILEGGPDALRSRPDLTRRTVRISALTVAEQLAGRRPPLMIDVRTEAEWCADRVGGSICVPLARLLERARLIPYSDLLVVLSGHGYRSSAAASLLRALGVEVVEMVGGMAAWHACRLPTVGEGPATPGSEPEAHEVGMGVRIGPRKFELGGTLCVDLEQRLTPNDDVAEPV
jgi:hydroxyacylglutathione hydrolase